jgi:MoxR-like ATPase
MAGRGHVVPGDLQSVLPQVLAHRLEPAPGSALGARAQVLALLQAVPA